MTEEPLEPRTQYEVRVRAKNGEPVGDVADNWSSVGRGTTGPSNSRPSFDRTDAVVELRVDENTRAGQNFGSAVSASDTDSNTLRYSLEGPGADSFTIISSSGQIRTKSPLDFETRQGFSLTVKVDDGQKRKNSVAAKSVTIMVDNVFEKPSAPAAPRVVGIPGSTDSVRVTWDAPANTGPSIAEYEVHYREAGAGLGFLRWDHFGVDRSTIITGLKSGTRYEVQVRARSEEGTSDWSRSGNGMPNPDVANRNPTFSGGARTLSVAENTLPNTDVGAPVAATDRDGDTLTYTLEGTDAGSFDILSTSDGGQIRTSAALNHEEKASYSVTVRVRDGRGGTDAVNLTIRVTDVDNEAPDTPFAPSVTAVSSTRLQVTWEAPANTGPPITDYDYRYREPSGSWTEITNTTITATTLTIEGLAASTSYDVEVRAKNAEGTSDWSNPGIGATNAPGANNPPVFSDGATATRSVSASAQAGASIGLPVAATDADSGDTLTYGLEGRDAGLFDINSSSGQLLTLSGISLIVGETYTVIVTADDQTDTARITVTIEVTAGPPNNAPVFSAGPRSFTVRANAPAGTAIGSVTATDADSGDTLTYSLRGTNAASFTIGLTSGQISTKAGITLTAGTYTVEVVASDTKDEASITVTITVSDNSPPAFPGLIASRFVAEGQPASAAVGDPVSATDPDQGDTLTYTLGGADEASFTIGRSSGQISTAVVLDYETKNFHVVGVTATDSAGESATIPVIISVTNVDPPDAPGAPTVTATAGSTTSLDVSWTAPSSDAPISGYDVQYRAGSTGGFTSWSHAGNGTSTVITGLTDGTAYEVQVRAQNSEGPGDWSASGTGTTNRTNQSPVFGDGTTAARFVAEDSPVGTAVGSPVSATDPDQGDALAYTLSGPDAASFTIGPNGQIMTLAELDYETKNLHVVVVTATDSAGDSATITVIISVTDVGLPEAPDAPTVTATAGSTTSLDVSWTAPSSDAAIADYDVQYRAGSTGGFTPWSHDGDGTSTVITGLTDGTSYEVQVRAQNSEGPGDWSASGTGTTTRANKSPVFGDGTTAARFVAEDSPVGTAVGGPVSATDPDGDTLSYTLGGADAGSFTIGGSSGQIRTAVGAGLRYEEQVLGNGDGHRQRQPHRHDRGDHQCHRSRRGLWLRDHGRGDGHVEQRPGGRLRGVAEVQEQAGGQREAELVGIHPHRPVGGRHGERRARDEARPQGARPERDAPAGPGRRLDADRDKPAQ